MLLLFPGITEGMGQGTTKPAPKLGQQANHGSSSQKELAPVSKDRGDLPTGRNTDTKKIRYSLDGGPDSSTTMARPGEAGVVNSYKPHTPTDLRGVGGRYQRRRRRCWALRLYFSTGVSW